jgi:D-alanyl-D-alanine endopeptidase (penicillin-binding protein 7)
MRQWRKNKVWLVGAVLALVIGIPAHAGNQAPAPGPGVKSAIAYVIDGSDGEVIYEQNANRAVPIASITKLMTALVVLDGQQPLDEKVEITAADRWKGKGAHSRLPIGARLTRGELLTLALMASENRAAHVLGRTYPGGTAAFVKTMNLKARALGMTKTRFADASGLSSHNVSTARDLAKLVAAATRDTRIRELSTQRKLEVRVSRKSTLVYGNTNLLVGKPDWDIVVQKTGFTRDAGECLVMQAMLEDRPVTMVFLNSFGKLTRTADARRVRRWMGAEPVMQVAGGAERAK